MTGPEDPTDLRMIVVCLRALRRWTQEELSRASGVDRGLISDYELGKKIPTRRTLERLAAGCGLLYGDVEVLLPIFRGLRQSAERRLAAARGPEEAKRRESFGGELAQAVGDSVRASLTPYLMELTALIDEEEEEEPGA